LVCFGTLTVPAGWIALAFLDWGAAHWMVREGAVIQWLQFALLLLAALYFFKLAKARGKHYDSTWLRNTFLILFAFCLMVAMEEISWGQQIVGKDDLRTPASLMEINAQKETTLHNLSYFHPYRFWLLILGGTVGLGASCLSMRNWEAGKVFPLLLPPLFFVLPCGVVALSGLLIEVAKRGELEWLWPSFSHLARGASFADSMKLLVGRFSEIAEFCVALTAFSYAALKHSEITTRIMSDKQRQLNSAS